jgi:hypothetical protein
MNQWGRGDSDMLKYAPLCGKVFQVTNLNQLSTAVDSLLLGFFIERRNIVIRSRGDADQAPGEFLIAHLFH